MTTSNTTFLVPNNSVTSAPTMTTTNTTTNAITTSNNQRYRYQNEIQAMMYTFGDVRHPLQATTLLIEDIIHTQMIELVMNECLYNNNNLLM